MTSSNNTRPCGVSNENTYDGVGSVLELQRNLHYSAKMAKKPAVPLHLFQPYLKEASLLAKQNRDVSQGDIARAIGCDQQTISRVVRGETRSGGWRWPLIRFLAPELWQVASEKNSSNLINELRSLGLQPKDDVVMTIAEKEQPGAETEYSFDLFEPWMGRGDMVMIFPHKPSAKTIPPNFPLSLRAYAFRMVGDMMRPTYRNGEIIYVDPGKDPEIGDDCVILSADRTRARVGHLIAISPAAWRITMRPETRFEETHELQISEWPFCEKIVGVRRA